MLKNLHWPITGLALIYPLAAFAIVLDCEQNPDGTYTCVEIGQASSAELDSPAQSEAAKIGRAYIEQARQQCTYRKPRARAGGKGSTSALKMEAMKSAQEAYEHCVASKAAELRNAEQSD